MERKVLTALHSVRSDLCRCAWQTAILDLSGQEKNEGEIEFAYKGKAYRFPAMSANETDIEEGEEVTVVHKEQGMCWVEKIAEELEEVED